MARPLKEGLDYWSFDVGLFRDKKFRLLKGEFGIKGVYIAIVLINAIYETNGYYMTWDNDECLLMSEGVGDGCTPELVSEVINGCLRCSLFDKGVYDVFGIITSAGIQRQYLKAIGGSRDHIEIIADYWLLDVNDKKDVIPSTCNKLAFKTVSRTGNPKKKTGNPQKKTDNAQSKVKERKVKKSKENIYIPAGLEETFSEFEKMRNEIKKPMTEYAKKLALDKLEKLAPGDQETQKKILEQSIFKTWQDLFPLKGVNEDGKYNGHNKKGTDPGATGTTEKILGNVV